MFKHQVKVVFLFIIIFSISYLAIAVIWANYVVEELLEESPSAAQNIDLQPEHLKALLKIEDPEFYQHYGLNISNGQGLTTISSVVARDLFLNYKKLNGVKGSFQSFYKAVFSCCKKIDFGRDVMAVVLDSHATKEQQLNWV
ncbi:hypothetical protein D5018_21295 [Parashewanella curva]|uniref:Glycosyl transferase family 51 domain-containing protein n=1 Tax=Parashewanella curva TaxID=2338552 RepID=A0A3L8PQP6_9GAMM|nr:hypothetical protein [Parashewanella curva]RLV57680.1 hypothetical protein D5018_21295 [Parashewanella curva]